jgi:hypothetical protein
LLGEELERNYSNVERGRIVKEVELGRGDGKEVQ